MMRLLHLVVSSLVGALFVHLLIVMLVPVVLAGRSHGAVAAAVAQGESILTGTEAAKRYTDVDPLFDMRLCVYDLGEGTLSVVSDGRAPFHSVTIVDDADRIVFSLVDRLSVNARIDMEILPESERSRYRFRTATGLADPGDTIPVFATRPKGHVIVRAFSPDAAEAPAARAFLEGIACETVPFGG